MPLIILPFESILLMMMKMNIKQFLFHLGKIRAEGKNFLSFSNTLFLKSLQSDL